MKIFLLSVFVFFWTFIKPFTVDGQVKSSIKSFYDTGGLKNLKKSAQPLDIVTAAFESPYQVCTNLSLQLKNTSVGASNYYWSFCEANSNSVPEGVDLGNAGGLLNGPVFIDMAQDNGGNFYLLVVNNLSGNVIRMSFGNSLLNTPTVDNLGNFGGAIPKNTEGVQILNVNGKWIAIIAGGDPVSGNPSSVAKIDFGTSLASLTPVAVNWGNIGGLNYPLDMFVFNESNTWYGYTVNSRDNSVTRFNFGYDFSGTPTGVNLGNPGNLNIPTGLGAINIGGNWYIFIANDGDNTLTRLNFGNSLLNVPVSQNIGNPGTQLNLPRDISFIQFCNNTEGFVVNAGSNTITRLDFGNDLLTSPSATSIGNIGNLNFPHSISKLFRVDNDIYSFIPNVNSNGISRLRFPGCTVPGSSLQNPPPITYTQPGVYDVNLQVDVGLPTQTSFCKQIVVTDCVASPCSDWLQLPSSPSYVAVGDLDVPGHQITVEAEINLTQPYTGGPSLGSDIVAKYADPTDANYLLRAQNAQITTNTGFYQTPDICPLQINKTYHIAMVYDGDSLKFYRNGFLMSAIHATGDLIQNNWLTQIGFYQYAFYNTNLIGYINEVRIWNIARTQSQIQSYMNIPLPTPTTQPGLLAYYTFNDLNNKQGNATWDGSIGGSALINQANPTCTAFIADNQCCPLLIGTFTGNTLCSNSNGMLTFHSSMVSTIGPFKLVYQDPTSMELFTADNVQNGVPFQTTVLINYTTSYNLISIQDKSSSCLPTPVSGISATVTVDNSLCNPCSSWLGLPAQPSYVQVGNLNVTGDQLTVEAEINMQYASQEGDIVSKHSSASDANYLLRPNHAFISTSNGNFVTPDICQISTNKTYHVAMVYDGTALKFYRNGYLMSQVAATGNLVQNAWQTFIGYYFNQALNENFLGYINEVRIWNVARTQSQIQAFMDISLPSPSTQTGLLAYYFFNDLSNKQGNMAWNGVAGGSAIISQTNPECGFVADNDCCPPMLATFTGNSVCSGQTGMLTFVPASTSLKPPYSITYSDQTTTYMQANVQSGIAFPVSANPATTTFYPLLKITDAANCVTDFSGITATITVFQPGLSIETQDTVICNHSSVQLRAIGGQNYSWTPAPFLDNPNIPDPIASPVQKTKFYVSGPDFNNCPIQDSVTIDLLPVKTFKAPSAPSVCKGMSVVLAGNNDPDDLYSWSPVNLLDNAISANPLASPDQTTVFHLNISSALCTSNDSSFDIQVQVNEPPVVVAGKSNDINCAVLSANLSATGAESYIWQPVTGLSNPSIANPVTSISSTTQFIVKGLGSNGCYGYDSITVAFSKSGENLFSLPNAFTPNGDGLNDCFGIRNWGKVTLKEFTIFNRWGQKVFETKNPGDCWDGSFRGEKQDASAFIYIIKASSVCELNIVRTGTFLLIR